MKSYRNFLGTWVHYILNYMCYVQHFNITFYKYNDLSVYDIFYLPHIYFWNFLWTYNRILHFCMIPAALFLITYFFFSFSNLLSSLPALLKIHKSFSYNFYLYISCFFYAFILSYYRHWKTLWNMFTNFFYEWIFRIIFTSISLFY